MSRLLSFWTRIFCLALLVCSAAVATAQEETAKRGFIDRVYQDDQGEHKYVVFVPDDYTPEKKWPIIMFLHGAGERGTDGRSQSTIGLGPMVKARAKTFPFIVVFPQCENEKGRYLHGWLAGSADGRRSLKILEAVEKEFSVDPRHRVLTGWSMGAYGTWSIASATPDLWSAVVPLAGGGDVTKVASLKSVPVWAFHGDNDTAIRPIESRKLIDALKEAGGNARYTELPKVDHDLWEIVYDSDELFRWMRDPMATKSIELALRSKPGEKHAFNQNDSEAFIPAVEVPRAVYVRLGNKMLESLAYSIPKLVPKELLSGKIDDIYDSVRTDGRDFSVVFSQISYTGELQRARIQAYKKDRLNVQLGLQNVTLQIGATYVTGEDHSATAGLMQIVLGHREPVWLSFDVTPQIVDRKLRLKLLATSFDIPNNNWYVTAPSGIRTRGFGMTKSKVSKGLVNGLYGSKRRIEKEIRAMVPSMVKQMEEKLTLADPSDMVNNFWPLPVHKPRVRIWPSEVSTDEQGISLVLGLTAAAVEAHSAPKHPRVVDDIGLPVEQVPRETWLQVGVAPELLRPLTQLMVDADAARIHVLDISEKSFAALADRKVLVEAIPDLKRFGDDVEIWSELILTSSMTVAEAPRSVPTISKTSAKKKDKAGQSDSKSDDNAGDPTSTQSTVVSRVQFQVPKLLISIAIKEKPADKWTQYAEFELNVQHTTETKLLKPNYQKRALRLDWVGEPHVRTTGRFAPGYKPKNSKLNVGKINELFSNGWRAWTSYGPVAQSDVPDIDLRLSKLRLAKVGWADQYLFLRFSSPDMKLTNSSGKELEYAVKGPYTNWGGPYKLKPGDSHEFEVPYPMLFRDLSSETPRMFTLPVGSHSEFRKVGKDPVPQLYLARDRIPEVAAPDSESKPSKSKL